MTSTTTTPVIPPGATVVTVAYIAEALDLLSRVEAVAAHLAAIEREAEQASAAATAEREAAGFDFLTCSIPLKEALEANGSVALDDVVAAIDLAARPTLGAVPVPAERLDAIRAAVAAAGVTPGLARLHEVDPAAAARVGELVDEMAATGADVTPDEMRRRIEGRA